MLIRRIELENIKSYRNFAVDFRRGTTAICGTNGAGKTTIVEAIGFALFDSILYKQGQFIREGEKYGKVVVKLIGSDDRPYEVERRLGTNAYWTIYDIEADSRFEQKVDVLDKLHDLFGIERDRPLDKLFQDALGVPQGTFTAIFLQPPAARKQTFDALLQIEDYKTASDYLLEAQKQYKEQMLTQQSEIQRLTYETQYLEQWRDEVKSARELHQQQAEQLTSWTQQLERSEERAVVLTQQRDNLRELEQQYKQSKSTCDLQQQFLHNHQQELSAAQAALAVVEENRTHYQRYLGASEALKQLRQAEQQRSALRQQHARVQNTLATIQANINNLQTRLEEVAVARRRLVDILPLFDQQVELEKQRDEYKRQTQEYDRLVKEGKSIAQKKDTLKQQQQEKQQRILSIEPLQPIAERLNEHIATVSRLGMLSNERNTKRLQFEEKRKQLQKKLEDRELAAANIRKAEATIARIEEHRQEAEELPGLQEQYEQLTAQKHRLEGNIEGYLKSRQESIGGQCPFLQEPCLNIKQRGVISLETYFDELIQGDQASLATVAQRQSEVANRMKQVKKFADELDKLGLHVEQHTSSGERLQGLSLDITRLEREVETLGQDLESLKQIDQQIAKAQELRDESQQADQQVRELDGLHKTVQQMQIQIDQFEEELVLRRKQLEAFSGSRKLLQQVEQALNDLKDPRAQILAQQEIINKESTYLQQLATEQEKQQTAQEETRNLEQQLQGYKELDASIAEQERIHQQSQAGYQTYLANEQLASQLPQRQQAYQLKLKEVEQAEQRLLKAEQAYTIAAAAFSEEELRELTETIKRLHGELKGLASDIRQTQEYIKTYEQQIEQAEARLAELEVAQKEYAALDELQTMMEQFRKLMKEAAPYVLKARLNDISAEANRIFGEIMGDRSAQLSWQNDYEIILRRQGVNRSFAQLSGGEQMSAALAVRLALLKKLSSLNIAFFDEPTQNMDELRRTNLAEQIRRVRGFDQLLVISHDDTFEQGLDSLVRLKKVDGETRLMTEEEVMAGERIQTYAS